MDGIILTSLIGSVFFGFVMLFLALNRKKLSNKYCVCVLRLNLLVYLFPFSLFSNVVRRWINYFSPGYNLCFFYPVSFYTKIFESSSKLILSCYHIFMISLFLLWLVGFLYLLWKKRCVYRGLKQLSSDEYLSDGGTCEAGTVEKIIASIQKDLEIKQILRVRYISGAHTPCVFGLFRPVVFLPKQHTFSEPVYTAILKHELFHIKNKDLVIQRLALVAMFFHWYNPVLYILIQVLNYYEELSADEYAVGVLEGDDRVQYGQALLEMVMSQVQRTAFVKGLGLPTKYVYKGRIMQLKMKKQCMSKIRAVVTALLLMLTFMCSTFPILAYTQNPTIIFETNMDYEGFASGDVTDMGFSEGISTDTRFQQNDSFFTDQNGNVYYETVQPQAFCEHSFVEGTYTVHERLGNGGCAVFVYEAERCMNCGMLKIGNLISTTEYVVCIH